MLCLRYSRSYHQKNRQQQQQFNNTSKILLLINFELDVKIMLLHTKQEKYYFDMQMYEGVKRKQVEDYHNTFFLFSQKMVIAILHRRRLSVVLQSCYRRFDLANFGKLVKWHQRKLI